LTYEIDNKFKSANTKSSNANSTNRVNNNNNSSNNFYDRFRNRLMIPIHRPDGQVLGFGARLLEEEKLDSSKEDDNKLKVAKYINSPETLAFRKNSILYGMHFAKSHIISTGVAILVEGYFDVISLYNSGVKNAVACMGTSLTSEQILSIINLGKKHGKEISIVVLFDSDVAGQQAVKRSCMNVFNLLPDTLDIRVAR
jgi:DNA primase